MGEFGEFVRLDVDGGIGTIRLDRPKLNALNASVQRLSPAKAPAKAAAKPAANPAAKAPAAPAAKAVAKPAAKKAAPRKTAAPVVKEATAAQVNPDTK